MIFGKQNRTDFINFYNIHKDNEKYYDAASDILINCFDEIKHADGGLTNEEIEKLSSNPLSVEFWSAGNAYANHSRFIPGNIYFFNYKKDKKTELNFDRETSFYDISPIALIIDYKKHDHIDAINMNLLPPKKRCFILQEMYSLNKPFYDVDFQKHLHDYKDYVIDEKSAMVLNKYPMDFIKKIMVDFKIKESGWAFRKYLDVEDYITNVHLIDFWKWEYIPFLDFSQSVDGIDIKKLQFQSSRKL